MTEKYYNNNKTKNTVNIERQEILSCEQQQQQKPKQRKFVKQQRRKWLRIQIIHEETTEMLKKNCRKKSWS